MACCFVQFVVQWWQWHISTTPPFNGGRFRTRIPFDYTGLGGSPWSHSPGRCILCSLGKGEIISLGYQRMTRHASCSFRTFAICTGALSRVPTRESPVRCRIPCLSNWRSSNIGRSWNERRTASLFWTEGRLVGRGYTENWQWLLVDCVLLGNGVKWRR